jgi:hypothetical protein
MFIYVVLEAIIGIIAGIMVARRTKKADGIVYGKLDIACRITNILLAIAYTVAAPFYLLLGMISEPYGEGFLIVPGIIVSLIIASAALFCALGLGFSVALRRKGKSKLSFAVQFAGVAGIALTVLLYCIFAGTLISPLN